MCPCDTWIIEKVTHGKMNSRVRGNFLSLEGNKKKKNVSKVKKKDKRKEQREKKKKDIKKKNEGECVRVKG